MMPTLRNLPAYAAWRHVDAREGFEIAFFFTAVRDGVHIEGWTTAVEAREPFAVRYLVEVDARWHTRSARVTGRSVSDERSVLLESGGDGHWQVDGEPAPQLQGCLDVDLEASAMTNALPVRRLNLAPGDAADAPAVYVRALDLSVERLEQRYLRVDGGTGVVRYAYTAPAFRYRGELIYDAAGLVTHYPGIARRWHG